MDLDTQSNLKTKFSDEENKELSEKYEILSPCGSGGCAKVYKAKRIEDGLRVAVKILNQSQGLDPKEAQLTQERFYAEARVLQKLTDKHSVQCYDYGVFEGIPCYVMEFVNGIQLNDYLRNTGALSIESSVAIISQVLAVLSGAHEAGIIHRDIKPENILVLPDTHPEEIRLIDFGIATIQNSDITELIKTQQGMIRGTPSYMAPEMFTGMNKATPEIDIYACGLVFLECLTGNIAVPGNSLVQIAYKQSNEDLVIPSIIPHCLSQIIWKCCEKDPANRYHNALDIIKDLETALPEAIKQQEELKRSYTTTQSSQAPQKPSQDNNNKLIYALLITFIILMIGGITAFVIVHTGKSSETQPPTEPVPAAGTETQQVQPPVPTQPEQTEQPAPSASPKSETQAQTQPTAQPSDVPTAQPSEAQAAQPSDAPADIQASDIPNQLPPQAQTPTAPADNPAPEAKPDTPKTNNPTKSKKDSKSKTQKKSPDKQETANTKTPEKTDKPKETNGKKVDSFEAPLSIF